MKKFITYMSCFSIPLFVLLAIYIATDVFKVIYHYDPYYENLYHIGVNRAYGSAMTFLNQNPKYHYNSFIFGSSRSLYYEIDTWKKYLPKGSSCMHFDEFGGSIGGVRDMVVFLDKHGAQVRNALLVVDHELLSRLEQQGYLFATPPLLGGYSNFISFHAQHFMAFLNPKFLVALADYNLFGTFRPYMKTFIKDSQSTYLPAYNEYQETQPEKAIRAGTYYDAEHLKAFEGVQKPGTFSSEITDDEIIGCLNDIKGVFDKQHTSYKVVISPLYDQVKLNPATFNKLCAIFGKDHVYDFSGVNKWNRDYHNYYEASHYRPSVAAEIMSIIYSGK